MCVFFIKQQPNDYPPESTFEGAHLPQFPQGIASLISDLILHCFFLRVVQIASNKKKQKIVLQPEKTC